MIPDQPILFNTFDMPPKPTARVETDYRRIVTDLPVPESRELLLRANKVFPAVNCYQAPVVWDRADGFQVRDGFGNCWIDFTSTAVATNTGHAHPAVREAIERHARDGLLAQFSFLSAVRVELAERLLELAPEGMEKVYFWTTGSETVESALRLCREWAMRKNPARQHVFSFSNDYHGCTLGAHQLSGESARKPWLHRPDEAIHRLPFPAHPGSSDEPDWDAMMDRDVQQTGIAADEVAAVVIETVQGWGAVTFPAGYVQALRRWADEHGVLLVFDEIQSGFGRTGKWFAHEHYGVRADLLCVGKGVTSSLPLAAVLGPAKVLDVLPPGEVTTTHAGHPLSCVAALANLQVLETEKLVDRAASTGELVRDELRKLQTRWPDRIEDIRGLGLLNAILFRDPSSGQLDPILARDVTFEAVRRGVMLFQVNRPSIKVCPPLVIPPAAAIEGVRVIGEAVESVVGG